MAKDLSISKTQLKDLLELTGNQDNETWTMKQTLRRKTRSILERALYE
jgi:hypothetical protein